MSKKKIIVVDDDMGSLRLTQSIFLNAGFQVITAMDGLDGLVKIKNEKPDLVVLDVMMPEINGYDVCYNLRFNKEFDKIPIILLTVRDQELDPGLAKRVNIEYVKKPVDPPFLLTKALKLLTDPKDRVENFN